ncbi:MAG: hypothetical protein HY363_04120 [Candidatus Aenigmarchaeota archaeon]|nr:hypothetical protein [Candidatus Aenigmarchaeota archaeon]
MTEHDIHVVTWAVVLIFVFTVFLIFYNTSITGKVTQQDIRLGDLQDLQTCSSNTDCESEFYCQPYDASGTPISTAEKFTAFGACLPI